MPFWQLSGAGRFTFVRCGHCGVQLGRGGRWQFYLVVLPMILGVILPLQLADNGYVSWSLAAVCSSAWFCLWYAIDVATVRLIPADQLPIKPLSRLSTRALQSWVVLSSLAPYSIVPLSRTWVHNLLLGRSEASGVLLIAATLLSVSEPTAGILAFFRLQQWRTPLLIAVLIYVAGLYIAFGTT